MYAPLICMVLHIDDSGEICIVYRYEVDIVLCTTLFGHTCTMFLTNTHDHVCAPQFIYHVNHSRH